MYRPTWGSNRSLIDEGYQKNSSGRAYCGSILHYEEGRGGGAVDANHGATEVRLHATIIYIYEYNIHIYMYIYICTFFVKRVHYVPMVGVEKRNAHKKWTMVIPEMETLVTGTTVRTAGPVPAGSRSERHRYAVVAWPG